MRKIRDYFDMIFTAVVCFVINLFSGKSVKNSMDKNQDVLSYAKRNRDSVPTECGKCGTETEKRTESVYFSPGDFLKKVFFWMQGPGDRKRHLDDTDFAACANAHGRSPDSCPGSDNVMHTAFSEVSP